MNTVTVDGNNIDSPKGAISNSSPLTPPLEVLPFNLTIPPRIFDHPNMVEMAAICRVVLGDDTYVVGTSNTQRPELYGWQNLVPEHRDNHPECKDSIVYFCLLSGRATVCSRDDEGNVYRVNPLPGQIVRMIDKYIHWTEGDGECIALFMGVFTHPVDALVERDMARGIARLSNPRVYRAPRAAGEYQTKRIDEVYAAQEFGDRYYLLRKSAASRAKLVILTCAFCGKPAVEIDKFWPYENQHRCKKHLNKNHK